MKFRQLLRHLAWPCCILVALVRSLQGATTEADLILHHGKIVAVDSKFTVQQAIAVTSNRITAVGDNESVLKHKGPTTRVVDLQGKMVLPGLIDGINFFLPNILPNTYAPTSVAQVRITGRTANAVPAPAPTA